VKHGKEKYFRSGTLFSGPLFEDLTGENTLASLNLESHMCKLYDRIVKLKLLFIII
jgi:hypothetical protein